MDTDTNALDQAREAWRVIKGTKPLYEQIRDGFEDAVATAGGIVLPLVLIDHIIAIMTGSP